MKYELALASPLFFWFPCSMLFGLLTNIGNFFQFPILIATGLISLIGSVLLLIKAKKERLRFYRIIPLCINVIMVIAAGVVLFLSKPSWTEGVGAILWAIILLMLAPCSGAVFSSLPESVRFRSASLNLTAAVSVYSVFTIYTVIYGGFNPSF